MGGPASATSDVPKDLAGPTVDAIRARCENSSNCSPSVGLLTYHRGDVSLQCKASLVGDDLLITASHCLPEELRKSGASCHGMIQVFFPATASFPEARVDALNVVSASYLNDPTRAQPDIAFIRLKTSIGRPTLKLDHSGLDSRVSYALIDNISDRDSVSDRDSETGRIAAQACHPVLGSEVLPGSNRIESSVTLVADCGTESSSEGAPLLDENGRIHGILQARIPPSRISKKIVSQKLLDRQSAGLSYVTNLACVRAPENDSLVAIPSACQDDPNEKTEAFVNASYQNLLFQSIRETDSRFQWPALSSDLDWHTQAFLAGSGEGQGLARALNTGMRYSVYTIPVPKCVSRASSLGATEFRLPVVGFVIGLDRYRVLNLDRGRVVDTVLARIEIASSFNRHANLFIDTGNGDWLRVFRAPLPDCNH